MTPIEGDPGEKHEIARYEVRPEALDQCLAAIHEFVARVRDWRSGGGYHHLGCHVGGIRLPTDIAAEFAKEQTVFTVIGKVVVAVSALAALVALPAVAAEPVVVIVKVFPTAGREEELQAQYLKRIEYLRKAEPNATFRLHRSARSPVTFLWYEVYPSQDAYEDHLKVVMPASRKDLGPTPEGVIARPSESETYIELAK